MNNAQSAKRAKKRGSLSNLSDYNSSDSDPFGFDWASLPAADPVPEAHPERRQSTRTQNKEVKYAESDTESDEASDDGESESKPQAFVCEHRIEHIYMSRESSVGLEYLVTFQNSDSPFAQWLSVAILSEIWNYPRLLRKFNETETPSFAEVFAAPDRISFRNPLHILSHRLLNGAADSKNVEYLFQLSLESGNVFFWEAQTPETPANVVEHYWRSQKCVRNTHPPASCPPVDVSMAEEFRSVDGQVPRDYQIGGVNWMIRSLNNGHGCILADEMGLGKTIQSLVFLQHLDRRTDWHGPHLIAVRINTFDQWCSELEKWSDLNFIAYTGQPETRHVLEKYQMPYRDASGKSVKDCFSFNILLATYDIILKDLEVMKSIDWQVMIVDEGHCIKNNDGKKHNALNAINAMHKIILTGTPIQNTLAELWTLLNFVSPLHFSDPMIFPEDDVESLDDDVLAHLRRIIAPHLMHRSLTNVEKSMVPKDERIAFLKLTDPQRDLLRLTKMHELWRVKKGGTEDRQNETSMMQRICNHPFLIEGTEEYYQEHLGLPKLELLVNCSAKLIFLDRILPIFKRAGSSVLIFSQRVKILKLLAEYCKLKKYSYEMLIGQLTDAEKKAAISKFCDTENDIFIFLISTRSGAEGLNLTRANIAIIFDPDWNPQNDLQAQGRCHRIGQTQKVDVLRLVTYGTYEHEMFARAQRKLSLWTSLLGDGKIQDIEDRPPMESNTTMIQDGLLLSKPLTDPSFFSLMDIKRDVPVKKVSDRAISVIPDCPDLTQLPEFGQYESYESIITKMATVVTNRDLDRYAAIPVLDLANGVSDEEFLTKFPSDPSMLAAVTKPKTRTASHRIQLDPKRAKMIIGQLVAHGYGKWHEIYNAINGVCPIDQMTKFCQTATVLHLRACNPARVCCFPLLIARLTEDIPSFDYSQAMCNDPKDWYTPFSKRGVQTSEGSVCRMISGRIHKTCISFLNQLETHILVEGWRNLVGAREFPFHMLPPSFDYNTERDKEVFESLIDKMQVKECDIARVGQICAVMKSEIIRRNIPIQRTTFPFWSIYEVNSLLNVFKSFGSPNSLEPLEFCAKTALLSKNKQTITNFGQMLYRVLSTHKPGNNDPLLLQNAYTMVQSAPHGTMQPIILEAKVVNDVVRRILLILLIRTTLSMAEKVTFDTQAICDGGNGWFTHGHCLMLCRLLLKHGCNSLAQVLLSDELGIRDRLLPSDVEFLRGKSYRELGASSMIPQFLRTNTSFLLFLKKFVENTETQNRPAEPLAVPSAPVTLPPSNVPPPMMAPPATAPPMMTSAHEDHGNVMPPYMPCNMCPPPQMGTMMGYGTPVPFPAQDRPDPARVTMTPYVPMPPEQCMVMVPPPPGCPPFPPVQMPPMGTGFPYANPQQFPSLMDGSDFRGYPVMGPGMQYPMFMPNSQHRMYKRRTQRQQDRTHAAQIVRP